jgi:hypothetical protein
MAGWPQNDRTTERTTTERQTQRLQNGGNHDRTTEQTTTERQTQRLQNGGNRYLPTPFLLDSGIGTYQNDLWYTERLNGGRPDSTYLPHLWYTPMDDDNDNNV